MTDERWKECKHHHHGCACREHAWEERVAGLEAEVFRLKGETHCAYCGESFPLDVSCEQIGNHIKACQKHPMRIVEAERDAARSELERLNAERDSLRLQLDQMAKVIAADTRRMLNLDGYRHE